MQDHIYILVLHEGVEEGGLLRFRLFLFLFFLAFALVPTNKNPRVVHCLAPFSIFFFFLLLTTERVSVHLYNPVDPKAAFFGFSKPKKFLKKPRKRGLVLLPKKKLLQGRWEKVGGRSNALGWALREANHFVQGACIG